VDNRRICLLYLRPPMRLRVGGSRVMSATNFEELYKHYAHHVVVAQYTGADNKPAGVAIECEDCHEVLLDYDNEGEGNE